jgi:hypothetical protein
MPNFILSAGLIRGNHKEDGLRWVCDPCDDFVNTLSEINSHEFFQHVGNTSNKKTNACDSCDETKRFRDIFETISRMPFASLSLTFAAQCDRGCIEHTCK